MTLDPNRNLAHPPLPPVPEKFGDLIDYLGDGRAILHADCPAWVIDGSFPRRRLVIGSVMAELWLLEAKRIQAGVWVYGCGDQCANAADNADAWRRWAGLEVDRG